MGMNMLGMQSASRLCQMSDILDLSDTVVEMPRYRALCEKRSSRLLRSSRRIRNPKRVKRVAKINKEAVV